MPQPERDTQRDRSGRRHAVFGFVGAGVISVAIFLILGRSEAPPVEPKSPKRPGGELWVQAFAADRQPILTLTGSLRVVGQPAISGRLEANGSLVFSYLASGSATVDLEAAGFVRLRKPILLGNGRRTLTLALEPGADVVVRVTDERGLPLPNVEVAAQRAINPSAPQAEPDAIRATTDKAGEALLEGLPVGPLLASASSRGHEPVVALEFETPRTDPLTLVLTRTARIEGFLLTQAGRLPAAGTVVVAGSSVWPPREIDVDASGRFEFDGLAGGVYELHGAGLGSVAEPITGLNVEPGETASITLLLVPSAELVVRVINENSGRAIAGASVSVGEDTMALAAATITTDTTGEARLGGLLPRPYRLSVTAAGYVSHPGSDHVPGAQPITLQLVAAAEIRGDVVDSDGHAIVGATIDIIGDTRNGAALAMTRGSLAFRTQLFGTTAVSPIPIARSDNLGVTIGVVPPIPVDTRLSPSPQAIGSDRSSSAIGFTSDTYGRFAVPGIPPGKVQLVVSQAGWAFGRSAWIKTTAGAQVEGVRIVLERGGRVVGRVVDDADFPMTAVTVELACADDPRPRSAMTDATGEFELSGALGDCTLTAFPRALPPARARLRIENESVHELTLKVAGAVVRISATVVDSGGFPVSGAAVQVRGLDPAQPSLGAALSVADGTVEVGELGPPPYQVDVSHPAFAPLHLRDVNDTVGLRWVLQAGAVLRGTVFTDSDRLPLVGARIELQTPTGDGHRTTRVGTLGMFEIHNVTAGNYKLTIEHHQTSPKHRDVAVSDRDVTRGELDLGETVVSQAGSVSGTVVDRLGAPVAGARVFVGASTTTSDSQGGFLLAGLTPGMVALEARHAVAGSAARPVTAKVFAGQETPGARIQLEGRFEATSELAQTVEPTTPATGSVTRGNDVAIAVATGRGGAAITSVSVGSVAERAGLRVGDVVTAVDGEPVAVAGQVRSMLRGDPDTQLVLEVTRAGRRLRFKLRRERVQSP